MRSLTMILAAALAALAAAATTASADAPRAHLRSFVCQRALDPASRAISSTAVMRPLPGTARMAMRFELLRRSKPGARAASVTGRALKTWITPTNPPTLGQMPGDVWIVNHPVVGLQGPDSYRFRVSFRWTGADGKVLGIATRLTRSCMQPELRPDLAVSRISVAPLSGGSDRYSVLVLNHGKTAAGPFNVELSLSGLLAGTDAVPALAPHASALVEFRAPACAAGDPLEVIADPGPAYQVDDANRVDNTLATACPGS